MIIHVATLNWQDSVTDAKIEELLENVRKIEVPGVHEVVCGVNASPLTQGLGYAIFCRADDVAALDRYREDPAHVAAAECMDVSQVRDESHQPGLVVDVEY